MLAATGVQLPGVLDDVYAKRPRPARPGRLRRVAPPVGVGADRAEGGAGALP
ncbi:hypothetical protein [Planomonospora algeriensis]